MPRRREVPKREVLPDPKFGNQDLSKFVNVLMTAGKKSVAERILYGALEQVGKTIGVNDLHIAAQARSQGLILVSNNLREFERVSGLLMENWVE